VKVGDEVHFEIIQIDNDKWKIWLKREWNEAELKEFEEIQTKKTTIVSNPSPKNEGNNEKFTKQVLEKKQDGGSDEKKIS
jgi:predicted RNA-binding protein with RPS1 domain